MAAEEVRLSECPRCGDLTLIAYDGAQSHRLARWSVPRKDAVTLLQYGVIVVRLGRLGISTYVREFDPISESNDPIAIHHVCGVDWRPGK
jgi:hypothetical protein